MLTFLRYSQCLNIKQAQELPRHRFEGERDLKIEHIFLAFEFLFIFTITDEVVCV